MVASVAVPRELAERAREIAAGRLSPVVPRDAATVMLLRERAGVEAYLLRRTRELDFAPGACVFPGGSVDERDADPEIGWAGPSPAELVGDSAALAQDRHALLAGTVSFGELLGRLGLMLRADLLIPWARWITPEAAPRRFDTWFFAAALPPGQTASLTAPAEQAGQAGRMGPGESDAGIWLRPAAALESARTGQITLVPPTAVTLGG